jgi:hypothetical protein
LRPIATISALTSPFLFSVVLRQFDEDCSNDIDTMELKRMMEKLGQAKTHVRHVTTKVCTILPLLPFLYRAS